jgi:tetratricopeptide (TPR) repeat protein
MTYHANALYDEARSTYTLAQSVDPKEHRWPYYRAMIDLMLGLNPSAISDFETALALEPTVAPGWVRLGDLRFRSGDRAGAEDAYRRALALAPADAHAAVGLARIFGDQGRWAEVVPLLESATTANPMFGPVHRMLALAYEGVGRVDDAKRHEGEGSQVGLEIRDPLMDELYLGSSTGSVLVTQAKIAESWGEFAKAERLLVRAAEVGSQDKDVQLAVGRFFGSPRGATKDRLMKARQHLEAAMRLDPAYLNVRHDHAIVIEALGDTAGAVRDWETILAAEPQHAMAHMSLGQVAYFRGRFGEAREHYRRGLEVPADTPYTLGERALGYHRLGLACLKAGHTGEALAAFAEATAEDPELIVAWTDWARLLKDSGRSEESVALFRRALATRRHDPGLVLAFGNHLLQLERFAEAREVLGRAKELSPRDPRGLAALGYATLRLGDVDAAIGQLREAVRVDPTFALAHFHLGNAFRQKGQTEDAARSFEEALRLNPRLGPARAALDELRGRTG